MDLDHSEARQHARPPADTVVGSETDYQFCEEQLPRVSRTFAACIGFLPPALERAVLLAYLLCRIADTIEDSPTLPVEDKRDLLAAFKKSLTEGEDCPAVQAAFADPQNTDEVMSRECDRVLRCYRALPDAQQAAILPWVSEMCDGMAWFSETYNGSAQHNQLSALESESDLERYCYYVAGTVGHLLTELFHQHHGLSESEYDALKGLSTSFGLGLQLTNIIKDIADDRQRNWSFVPRQLCLQHGLELEHLLDPAYSHASAQVMNHLIEKAQRHLDDALRYCTHLPHRQYRIRLFCLTPLYFAIRTLRQAANDPRLLDPKHKVKISRRQVYRTICATHAVAPSNRLIRQYYQHLAARG